jgi:hypothetical protein
MHFPSKTVVYKWYCVQCCLQYPTFSPCYYLPWRICIRLNQSECIFPRNSILTGSTEYRFFKVDAAWRKSGTVRSIAHSIICTRLFRGKMHSDSFNGIQILQSRWQHAEIVGYCCPVCPAGHERVKRPLLSGQVNAPLVTKELNGHCWVVKLILWADGWMTHSTDRVSQLNGKKMLLFWGRNKFIICIIKLWNFY